MENFSLLNTNTKGIILVNKISVSKVKNIEETKIIPKKCLMLYILQLSSNKEELSIELSVEPFSGYYLFKFSEKEAKIFDERKFFNSLTNYYRTIDKEIFETIKNFNYLMKDSITAKLNRENGDGVESELSSLRARKKSSKLYTYFNFKHAKKEGLYNSYLCFATEELKKDHQKLINKIDQFKNDLKDFCENTLEDKNNRGKFNIEGVKKSLQQIHEFEYKILEKKSTIYDITFIEKIIVDRFYVFFLELLNSIMDYKFEDEEKW